jgi:oligoendopeptidase F
VYGVHPFIKLNYNGQYDSVSTLAHELGHAMHSRFAEAAQPYATADYPTFLAEIASTFNENLLMDYLLRHERDDQFKLAVLDGYLERVRATLYRQTLFAEFELAMHRRVEAGQALTADWLDDTYLGLTRAYYGHDQGVCAVGDYLANEWSGIPHFYMNYYVFQYSTGIIASMALSDMVLTGGAPARDRYLGLLKAGGSGYPIDLLRAAGVDMATAAPAQAAFQRFDRLVGEMEKIVGRLEKRSRR